MKMKEKYSEEYFEHWLAMLSTMNSEFTKEGFEIQIKHYIDFEGVGEMQNLKSEVELITKNGDLNKFLKIGRQFDIEEINEQTLEIMALVIKDWSC